MIKKNNYIIMLLTAFLYASFFIFSSSSYGSLLLALEAVLIIAVTALFYHGKIILHITGYHVYMLAFSIFCYLSAMWAWDSGRAITDGTTILEILICMALVYVYYQNKDSVESLLKSVMWGGNMVMLYIIVRYGFTTILSMLTKGQRIPSEFLNSNTLGIVAAISIIINLHFVLTKKQLHWWNLFAVVGVTVVAVSASRKALVFMIAGCIGVLLLKSLDERNMLKAVLKGFAVLCGAVIVGYIVIMLPMFENLRSRMDGLLAMMMGVSGVDNSSLVRQQLVEIGISQFKKTPILGIGIGNPHFLVSMSGIGEDYYLHNNFVELLAGGGVVGFACFYSMYAYLLLQMWKLRAYRDGEYAVVFVLLIILLIMDYGMVSYYSKSTYFYLMVIFLYVQTLKRKKKEGARNEI